MTEKKEMPRGIKFEPILTLGHVLQALVIVVVGVIFAIRLEARMDVQSIRQDAIEARMQRIEQRAVISLSEIKERVDEIKRAIDDSRIQRDTYDARP